MRIAVITPIPTPYRDPMWGVLAAQPGMELSVFYCAAGKADRPWEVDWKSCPQSEVLVGSNLLSRAGGGNSLYWNPSVLQRLQHGAFDAVLIGGYNHPTMLAAILWCLRHRVPYYLMCESHLHRPRGRLRAWAKRGLVRWIVRRMAGGFPTGQLAAAYLEHYGADRSRLALLPNAPDVDAIRCQVESLRHDQSTEAGGPAATPVVLFVGRLIRQKRAACLIRAYAEVVACGGPGARARLVIAGDGPELPSLVILARELGVADRVEFKGFVAPRDMPRLYADAHLFVLPSAETWGVVVSEALAADVPVVVSDQVGCHPDIVPSADVGTVVPLDDERALAEAIRRWIARMPARDTVRATWQGVFAELQYRKLARRVVDLLKSAAGNASPTGAPAR